MNLRFDRDRSSNVLGGSTSQPDVPDPPGDSPGLSRTVRSPSSRRAPGRHRSRTGEAPDRGGRSGRADDRCLGDERSPDLAAPVETMTCVVEVLERHRPPCGPAGQSPVDPYFDGIYAGHPQMFLARMGNGLHLGAGTSCKPSSAVRRRRTSANSRAVTAWTAGMERAKELQRFDRPPRMPPGPRSSTVSSRPASGRP